MPTSIEEMKINETLVKQVQDGTHCIEHTKLESDLPKLVQVLDHIFPECHFVASGSFKYYHVGFYDRNLWNSSDSLSSGMTSVPLQNLFEEEKPDCCRHKKEIAGTSDMKVLADMIGDLHYETLTELLGALAEKISMDGHKDESNGREKLAEQLYNVAGLISKAQIHCNWAWQISKPFMTSK